MSSKICRITSIVPLTNTLELSDMLGNVSYLKLTLEEDVHCYQIGDYYYVKTNDLTVAKDVI